MTRKGCLALHGVNLNLKKKVLCKVLLLHFFSQIVIFLLVHVKSEKYQRNIIMQNTWISTFRQRGYYQSSCKTNHHRL